MAAQAAIHASFRTRLAKVMGSYGWRNFSQPYRLMRLAWMGACATMTISPRHKPEDDGIQRYSRVMISTLSASLVAPAWLGQSM